MKIKAIAKVSFIESSISEFLLLEVCFRIPGKPLKVKRDIELCNSWWIGNENGYRNYEEFLEDCVSILKNPNEKIIPVAKELVMEYINREAKDLIRKDLRKEIHKLIKKNRKYEIEVDVESK